MPKITADIPASLNLALKDEITRTNSDEASIITAALAQYLKTPVHTLFQVSTSGALVAGVYSGAVSVMSLLQHGDIGLGTFANLDGEMVVLDWSCLSDSGFWSRVGTSGRRASSFRCCHEILARDRREDWTDRGLW